MVITAGFVQIKKSPSPFWVRGFIVYKVFKLIRRVDYAAFDVFFATLMLPLP
jgi:hypothetical protein